VALQVSIGEQRLASIALGLTCLGCLLLSVSLRRHFRQVFTDESTYERRMWPLRWSGYALASLALWPCILATGLSAGIILWLSMVALAAFVQIMLLTYRPRANAAFGALGVVLIAVGLLL
jgi:hypothetical protein